MPDFLSALFQESDRIEARDEENEIDTVHYRASRDSILRRLNLMGCTEALSERRFKEWRDETIRKQKAYLREYENDEDYGADENLKALLALMQKRLRRLVIPRGKKTIRQPMRSNQSRNQNRIQNPNQSPSQNPNQSLIQKPVQKLIQIASQTKKKKTSPKTSPSQTLTKLRRVPSRIPF